MSTMRVDKRVLNVVSDPGLSAAPERERSALRADCERCFGLCCVAPSFSASADFALDKEAGKPCPNLQANFRCAIHTELRPRGFVGCTVYDCFGAGQKISQHTYGGQNWRAQPSTAGQMFDVFPVMRTLHQMLWYLSEALTLEPARALWDALRRSYDETELLTRGSADALQALDLAAQRNVVDILLRRVSALVRGGAQSKSKPKRGGDLIGAKLRRADLRGRDLRGALLIAADLREADLRLADLIGADLRAADLCGADLTSAIFLTQSQLNAAKGDRSTKLPPALIRPSHWSP